MKDNGKCTQNRLGHSRIASVVTRDLILKIIQYSFPNPKSDPEEWIEVYLCVSWNGLQTGLKTKGGTGAGIWRSRPGQELTVGNILNSVSVRIYSPNGSKKISDLDTKVILGYIYLYKRATLKALDSNKCRSQLLWDCHPTSWPEILDMLGLLGMSAWIKA